MTNPVPRWQLLEWAAGLQRPALEIKARLRTAPHDPNQPDFAVVTRHRTIGVLERFIGGEFDGAELEEWANLIEGNDEFRYETIWEPLLREIVFQAANPALEGDLTPGQARAWLQRLTAGLPRT